MSRKGKLPLLQNVVIEDFAAEGKCLAHVEGQVVFVAFTAPGDVVDIQVTRKRHGFMEGYVTDFHQLSDHRLKPFCSHFGMCGGCKWQHVPYHQQLQFKQKQVVDQLSRIAKIQLPEVLPILGSDMTQCYRNKLEFTFAHAGWLTNEQLLRGVAPKPALGYHLSGRFDRVFDVDACGLQREPSNGIRLSIKNFALHNGIPFMNLRTGEGILRNLIVRTASTGDVMAILSVTRYDTQVEQLLEHLIQQFPELTSLFYVENDKANDTINDLDLVLFHGRDYILEVLDGIKFRIGPKSFYQTNSEQARRLYSVVRSFAQLSGNELVYDLYTGTGTIANFVASAARQVLGIEYVPEAIADARVNSQINSIANTEFFAGDIKDLLTPLFMQVHGQPDVVILDPPRAGVHPDVLKALLQQPAPRMVYVSCNPATQARDLAVLDQRYEVKKIQPVDMFPHTHHVENVVLIELRT